MYPQAHPFSKPYTPLDDALPKPQPQTLNLSPLMTSLVVPYALPYITPLKEHRLWLLGLPYTLSPEVNPNP